MKLFNISCIGRFSRVLSFAVANSFLVLTSLALMLPLTRIYAQEEAPVEFGDVLPVEVEGVYNASGPVVKEDGDQEIVRFKITIIQSARTGAMNLSIATYLTQATLFYASEVIFQRAGDEVVIESFGVNFKGVRQYMHFTVDPKSNIIHGIITGNFLENSSQIEITGKKDESIFEEMSRYASRSCGSKKDYVGSFHGQFGANKKAQLHIHEVLSKTGDKVLSGNISGSNKVLYHDGYFSESYQMFTFVNDIMYPMNGKSKKLVLFCDQDEEFWTLKGIHISSNGSIIRDIAFKKKK